VLGNTQPLWIRVFDPHRLIPFFLIAGIALMVVGGIGFLAQHL